jgi:23S rRNA (cytosine1962-C5)-methyltransferase
MPIRSLAMSAEARSGYRLLDAGDGGRLEQFGDRLTDRPAPQALDRRQAARVWARADLRFEPDVGWTGAAPHLEPWTIEIEDLRLELRPTASGQVGLYPEHLSSLPWLRRQVRAGAPGNPPPTILNLFAYTGVTTLALAASGASVVHVDAARSAVEWARRNAAASELEARPVRWIVDDAMRFVAREIRRGRRYDGIVLDPPAWGHADSGRAWRLEADIAELLAGCARLLGAGRGFCLLTAHSMGLTPDQLGAVMAENFGATEDQVEVGPMELLADSGARLLLGGYARFALDTRGRATV